MPNNIILDSESVYFELRISFGVADKTFVVWLPTTLRMEDSLIQDHHKIRLVRLNETLRCWKNVYNLRKAFKLN